MNKYAFLTDPARNGTEMAENYGRFAPANAKHCEPLALASHGVNRYRSLLQDKSFSLILKADDGSTLLEAHVEYMHQAFQTLIDWSIDETSQDACAVITGPNGFYTNHRIKASRDFDWIESRVPCNEIKSANPLSQEKNCSY
jgi:hypothetical protein